MSRNHLPMITSAGGDDEALGWIWRDNLVPFLEVASRRVGYAFDDLDREAFDVGLPGTDSERGPWFRYPLGHGDRPPSVAVALEPGAAEMVSVQVAGVDATVVHDLSLVAELCSEFRLVTRATGEGAHDRG